MRKQTYFNQPVVAILLIAPQLLVTLVFFIWPAMAAVKQAFFKSDPWGLQNTWVGFANFLQLCSHHDYLNAVWVTGLFSVAVALLAVASGLLLATLVNGVIKGASTYKTLLIWPYAVAPAVAGMLWRFLFNPAIGLVSHGLQQMGYDWNYLIHPKQALLLVVMASAWQQFSYNFIFFLAGLQSIPKAYIEAAALDGAGPFARFRHIVLPLLSPTTFFLLIINLIYAFFDTFGVIQVVTQGGPAAATTTLVFKVYSDGFMGLDLGGSATQSIILMLIVILLTLFQFRFIERKVHYT